MFEFFANCIFCNAPLPDNRTGQGEHIIPRSVFGFWRTYDVCLGCREAFGISVDQVATQSVALLNCMEVLKLKDTGPHLDNLAWTGSDTLDKRKVSMIKRGPGFRIKVTRTNDFLECSEQDLDALAKPWLRGLTGSRLSSEEFEKEYEHFKQNYYNLKLGETYHSHALGYTIRRRQSVDVRVSTPTPSQFTRLIAKIVFCFIHYAFPVTVLEHIEEYHMLKHHARYGDPLRRFSINPLGQLDEGNYYPFHRIGVYPNGIGAMIDTTFFGNVGWRAVLHSKANLSISDSDGRLAEYELFLLDFSNPADRHKYAGYKFPDQEGIDWYEVGG